jgi:soluble lytic murein transglycosylase-like protein
LECSEEAVKRTWFAAVLAAAAVSLSGGPVGVQEAGSGRSVAGSRRERVSQRMRQLNPRLSAGQVDRIWRAVDRYSAKYELEPELVLAVLEVESGARVVARSPKGALGLMQVMPHMAARLDVAGSHTTIETNIEAGCLILSSNIRRLGEADGISAYFWGSDIRGVGYLNRIRAVRAYYRKLLSS